MNSRCVCLKQVVDQLADVGFEMLVYSFQSGFNIESLNETYISEIAADIAYANKKGTYVVCIYIHVIYSFS